MSSAGLDHHRGGSGEPLVLVHGLGHTWRGWKPMLPLLERRFEVLAVDLPGFGHSPALPEGTEPHPEALADAVERAMLEAGFERAHLAGNSLGGFISLELARRGRARSVAALSPAGLAWGREKTWARALLRALRAAARTPPPPDALLASPFGRTLLAGPTLGKPWRADPADLAEQRELLARAPAFDAALEPTLQCQPRGLGEIRCPVLVLWGTRDLLLLPRQGRRFAGLIPGSELRYLRGLGHVPMSDDPELLAAAIEEVAARAS